MKKLLTTLAASALALAVISCGQAPVDYSKAAVQTGGPEQGEWRNANGTLLSLNSGKYSYKKGTAMCAARTTSDSPRAYVGPQTIPANTKRRTMKSRARRTGLIGKRSYPML